MPHVKAGDLRMYYEEHGQPDGPTLVLLHGFTLDGTMWRHQFSPFGERYRLLVPDLRGHGRTHNPAGLVAMNHRQFARDIIAFCHALGLQRASFCGESSGAHLLLSLALTASDLADALVLAGATYCYDDALRAWWATQTPETLLGVAGRTPPGPPDWQAVASAFITLGGHAHTDDFPEGKELGRLTAPTLIIHGDRDRFFPVAIPVTLYELLPDAEFCVLPATGHMPPAERPAWFNAIALDFLKRRARYETSPE